MPSRGNSPTRATPHLCAHAIPWFNHYNHIEQQHMHFYMNAHMSCQCPEPLLTPSHMHMLCIKKPSFPKQNIFVLYFNSLDSLKKTVLFKIHVSFVGNGLFEVSPHVSYTFRHFCGLSPLDAYVSPRIQAFHLRGCLSLLATSRHKISNLATLGRHPFFQSPPFKHQTQCSFMPCTHTCFTQCPSAYAMQNAIACSFMLHA